MTDATLIASLQAAHLEVRKRLTEEFAPNEWMYKKSLQDLESNIPACQHYRTLSRADPDGEFARKAKRILPRYQCHAGHDEHSV
jgi:hypothetical protein